MNEKTSNQVNQLNSHSILSEATNLQKSSKKSNKKNSVNKSEIKKKDAKKAIETKNIPLCTNYDSDNDEPCECHHRMSYNENDDEEEEEEEEQDDEANNDCFTVDSLKCNFFDATSTKKSSTCSSPFSRDSNFKAKCWHHQITATTTSNNSMISSASSSCSEINRRSASATSYSSSINKSKCKTNKIVNDAGYSSELDESNAYLEMCNGNVDQLMCTCQGMLK